MLFQEMGWNSSRDGKWTGDSDATRAAKKEKLAREAEQKRLDSLARADPLVAMQRMVWESEHPGQKFVSEADEWARIHQRRQPRKFRRRGESPSSDEEELRKPVQPKVVQPLGVLRPGDTENDVGVGSHAHFDRRDGRDGGKGGERAGRDRDRDSDRHREGDRHGSRRHRRSRSRSRSSMSSGSGSDSSGRLSRAERKEKEKQQRALVMAALRAERLERERKERERATALFPRSAASTPRR